MSSVKKNLEIKPKAAGGDGAEKKELKKENYILHVYTINIVKFI